MSVEVIRLETSRARDAIIGSVAFKPQMFGLIVPR